MKNTGPRYYYRSQVLPHDHLPTIRPYLYMGMVYPYYVVGGSSLGVGQMKKCGKNGKSHTSSFAVLRHQISILFSFLIFCRLSVRAIVPVNPGHTRTSKSKYPAAQHKSGKKAKQGTICLFIGTQRFDGNLPGSCFFGLFCASPFHDRAVPWPQALFFAADIYKKTFSLFGKGEKWVLHLQWQNIVHFRLFCRFFLS